MLTMRGSLDSLKDPQYLDDSVREVFETMLGIDCTEVRERRGSAADEDSDSVTAVVGFGGVLSGACIFRCSARSAMRLAARMTAMEFDSVDDTVMDGLGEICNMVAGTWKGKIPELAANCGLSTPAVITGNDYHLHVQSPEFRIDRGYAFEDLHVALCVMCDGVK